MRAGRDDVIVGLLPERYSPHFYYYGASHASGSRQRPTWQFKKALDLLLPKVGAHFTLRPGTSKQTLGCVGIRNFRLGIVVDDMVMKNKSHVMPSLQRSPFRR
ncbi:hypothetical protein PoB_001537500 [Plakobranchus ocellatus]|uniref:Uncharacterized protein n=1 Tax=Plakobranchus ocellatus TaxID=259542 RepID=A0AAV3Z2M1_9GAST|nr:hypothetical protein PoB_001537500 [Plakobranchus ocellatus]